MYDESIRNVFRGIICSFAVNDNNNNNLANDSSHIPNILNKHFSNVGNISASKLPPAERPFKDYLTKSNSPELSFFFKPVTPSEI